MSRRATTHAGSREAGDRLSCGAPAFCPTFPDPRGDCGVGWLYLPSSFFCRPDPGPLASMKNVRPRGRPRPRVRGRVPEFQHWNSAGTGQVPDFTGQLRLVPEFQRFALAREACGRADRRAHHEANYWNSGTLELEREAIEAARFSGSSAVPARPKCWNSASIKIGGGYASVGSIAADPHRFEGAAPENFPGRAQLGPIEGGSRVAGRLVQAPSGNGGKPPFLRASCGVVGTRTLERCGKGQVDQRLSPICYEPRRLTARALGEAGGASIASRGGGAPNRGEPSRRTQAQAIFSKTERPSIVGIGQAVGTDSLKTGSGVSVLARPRRLDRETRQKPDLQHRVGVQMGVLVPPAKAGGCGTLAGGQTHVNA